MTISLNSNNSIHLIDSKTVTWNIVQKRNDCVVDISATAKFSPCETLLTGMILDIPCAPITQKDTICSAFAKLQCQLTEFSGVLTVTDDGSGVVVVDNTDPQNPVVGFGGVNVDGITITGDGSIGSPLVSAAGAPFIISIADTNTIDLNQALGVLTANLRYVDSVDFDLSDGVAGFTGVLTTTGVVAGTYGDATNVGQFTVDAKGRLTSAVNVPIVIAEPNTQIVYGTGAGIDSNADFTFDLTNVTLLNGAYIGQINSNSIYSNIILQNLNPFISYITWKNDVGTEKFYVGYRQQNLTFDILSESNTGIGIRLDESGRVVIGTKVGAYIVPDVDYSLSVDSRIENASRGMVLRGTDGLGIVPITFKLQDTAIALVEYATIECVIVSNTAGSHSGRLLFSAAKSGITVPDVMSMDATSLSFLPHGVAAGNTVETRYVELAASGTNYVGFKSPDAIAANVIWTLPIADATVSGYVLSSNAAGVLSWVSATGSGGTVPAGTIGQTLYYAANGTVVTPSSAILNDVAADLIQLVVSTGAIIMDGGTGIITIGDAHGFEFNTTTDITKIGDYQGSGSGTVITVNDLAAQTITYGANNGHTFNGTGVTINGKLTVTGAIDPTHLYLDEQAGDPVNVANKGILYTKDVATVTQLFYMTSAGTAIQLTPLATAGANTALSNLASVAINTSLLLGVSDGGALGSTTFMWSDLFLANGSVINFNAGDVLITHSSNSLVFSGAASGYQFNTLIRPTTNDGTALGTGVLAFSDLFLASGAVIDFNNGDVVITHSTDTLAISGTTSVSFNSNVVIGGTTLAASATAGLHMYNGTIPSASIVDGFVMYAADFGATSMPHFRGENGNITKLFTSSGTITALGDMFTSYVQHGFYAANGFTSVPANEGGTGITAYDVGDILYANGVGSFARLGDIATGNVLLSGGVTTAPLYGKVGLTTHVSGVLPIANGGSNKALTLVNGGVLWTDADSFEVTAAGTQNQVLKSNGAAAPTWTDNPIGILACSMGAGNTVPASTTSYAQFFFGNSVGTNETQRNFTIRQACTIKNFTVRTSTTQDASGAMVITVRKNGAGTTVTTTIAAGTGAGTFTDVANSFTAAAGDVVTVQFANAATAASANILEDSVWMYL